MINLLPPESKKDMFYGRRNTTLRHWVIAVFIAVVGAGLIVGAGYLYLERSITNQSASLEASKEALKSQKVDETQKQLADISGNTKLIIQVLSREILFSKLLRQLGASLPANTTLTELQIDQLQGGIALKAVASDINSATQLQVNLQDPKNGIFEKADIESISCSSGEDGNKYPCSVQIRALFSKSNPYTYIAPSGSTTGGSQ